MASRPVDHQVVQNVRRLEHLIKVQLRFQIVIFQRAVIQIQRANMRLIVIVRIMGVIIVQRGAAAVRLRHKLI